MSQIRMMATWQASSHLVTSPECQAHAEHPPRPWVRQRQTNDPQIYFLSLDTQLGKVFHPITSGWGPLD